MQAVGKFDKQSTNIVVQRCKHLFIIIYLLRRFILLLFLLCYHIYKKCHVIAITLFYIIDGVLCIFGYIVQKSGNNRIRSQSQLVGYNARNSQRMHYIGLTRFTPLFLMCLFCKEICILYTCNILFRQTSCQRFEQLLHSAIDFLIFHSNKKNTAILYTAYQAKVRIC